jgi:hypothetical protein
VKSADFEKKVRGTLYSAHTPLLQIPNNYSSYQLETNALDFATGAVLEQLGEDGKWQPVAFSSKSLNAHKHNYKIYDKELLAIIRALEEY